MSSAYAFEYKDDCFNYSDEEEEVFALSIIYLSHRIFHLMERAHLLYVSIHQLKNNSIIFTYYINDYSNVGIT
jgi:hypothetical protein